MLRANERYNLCLSRKQLNQIAKEAFRDIGTRMQERRHLDLVYNFGSHLTDSYKPGKVWVGAPVADDRLNIQWVSSWIGSIIF